jgi:hypothetical protein
MVTVWLVIPKRYTCMEIVIREVLFCQKVKATGVCRFPLAPHLAGNNKAAGASQQQQHGIISTVAAPTPAAAWFRASGTNAHSSAWHLC